MYSERFTELLNNIQILKEEFNKSFKCLNKTNVPSKPTQVKHLNIIIHKHNDIIDEIIPIYQLLQPEEKIHISSLIQNLRTRFSVLINRLNAPCNIPTDILDYISAQIDESSLNCQELETASDSENSSKNDFLSSTQINMTKMTPAEFLGLASKLLPDFDGKPENLVKFTNALDLLDSIKEEHESIAISLIKTKLSGVAQTIISNENTIAAVKASLTAKIKGESAQSASAKLLNAKQNSKSPNEFAKEIEQLTLKLQNAYLLDGLSSEVAQNYATQMAVKSISKNARSPEVKLLMKAGNFTNINDVITKFIDLNNDTDNSVSINFIQNTNQRGGYNNGNRGRGNYRNRGRGYGNQNYGNRNNQNYASQSYQNNRNQNNRGRSSNIRTIEANPENETGPQLAQLGNL